VAASLNDFEIARALVANALDYVEASEDGPPEFPGVMTEGELTDLRAVLHRTAIRVSQQRRSEEEETPDLEERIELFDGKGNLLAELWELRQQILSNAERHALGEHPPGGPALASYGVRIIDRALVGEASREEVVELLEASAEVVQWRRERGKDPYEDERALWHYVFARLAESLGASESAIAPDKS
jgi:hypothetical protein